MGNPCHPRSASQLHHRSVENKLWGRKCGDSMEINFAQSCRLIGGGKVFCSLGNAAMTQCPSFHHPPVILFYDLICISDRTWDLSASFSLILSIASGGSYYKHLVWLVCRMPWQSHGPPLATKRSWCTSVYLHCYNTLSLFVSSTVLYSRYGQRILMV